MRPSVFALFSLVCLMSCAFEEGPDFSLASRKARVVNTWRVQLATLTPDSGPTQDLTASLAGYTYNFRRDWTLGITLVDSLETLEYEGDWELAYDNRRVDFLATRADSAGAIYAIRGAWWILRLSQKEFFVETEADSALGRIELVPVNP